MCGGGGGGGGGSLGPRLSSSFSTASDEKLDESLGGGGYRVLYKFISQTMPHVIEYWLSSASLSGTSMQ